MAKGQFNILNKFINLKEYLPSRGSRLTKQITGTLGFRMLGMTVSLVNVRLLITLFGPERYGVWITLLSLASWALVFNFGLASGLQTELSASIEKEEFRESRHLIWKAYYYSAILAAGLMIISILAVPQFSWQAIYNCKAISEPELETGTLIILLSLTASVILSPIDSTLRAYHKAHLSLGLDLLTNLLIFFAILVMIIERSDKIMVFAALFGAASIIPRGGASVIFFARHPELRPQIPPNRMDRRFLSIGTKFFVMNLCGLVLFSSSRLIIAQLFGPSDVAAYDTVYKLFQLVITAHTMIMIPFWASFGSAYASSNFSWIRRAIRKLNFLMIPIVIGVAVLAEGSNQIVRIWIGPLLHIPPLLIPLMALYTVVLSWDNIYIYALNGFGKINLQMYLTLFAAAANIPLSIILGRFVFGSPAGVVAATVLSLLLTSILLPRQVFSLIRNGERSASITAEGGSASTVFVK